jgi:hypothetical protein
MGLPARPEPGAATWGFAYDMAIFGQNSKVVRPAKIFCEAHNFVRRWNFDKRILRLNREMLQMRIAVSRE